MAISAGTAAQAARTADHLQVSVPLFADPTGAALDALGVTRVVGPMRRSGTIVVDASGTVRYARQTANPGTALRWGEVEQALASAQA